MQVFSAHLYVNGHATSSFVRRIYGTFRTMARHPIPIVPPPAITLSAEGS